MISLASLWLPIVVSAVVVFFVSFLVHTVLPLHKTDFRKVPREDEVMTALRPFAIAPGEYSMPFVSSGAEARSPEFAEKAKKGPVVMLKVRPNGLPAMGKPLVQWFVYCLVVSLFAAYIAAHAVPPGGRYLAVFRFVGAGAFLAYSLGLPQEAIWFSRSWRTTAVSMLDGLVYALLSAGIFGWLWPR